MNKDELQLIKDRWATKEYKGSKPHNMLDAIEELIAAVEELQAENERLRYENRLIKAAHGVPKGLSILVPGAEKDET